MIMLLVPASFHESPATSNLSDNPGPLSWSGNYKHRSLLKHFIQDINVHCTCSKLKLIYDERYMYILSWLSTIMDKTLTNNIQA